MTIDLDNRNFSLNSFEEQSPLQSKKKLTQEEWEMIYHDRLSKTDYHRSGLWSPSENLESILLQRGFSTEIEGIDFSKTDVLSIFFFKNLHFKNCNFPNVNLEKTYFESVRADSCTFENSRCANALFQNTFFKNSNFQNATFINTRHYAVTYIDCNLSLSCFNDSSLKKISIIRSQLLETNFLNATVDQGKLTDCDLTDTLLLDAKEHFEIQGGAPHRMTRPIVALGCLPQPGPYTNLMIKALRDNGAILLSYVQEPDIDNRKAYEEIYATLSKYEDQTINRPQTLLSCAKKGSEIDKIRHLAATILQNCQGLAIPGGDDIERVLYQPAAKKRFGEYILRSMFEIALLAEAERNNTPTIGICRGAQMINIYFGGTLLNHVKGQDGIHRMHFTDSTHAQWLRNQTGKKLYAESNHHQAVDKVGQGLHVILKKGKVPKLLISENGQFIASQIHPESYISLKEQYAQFEDWVKSDNREKFSAYLLEIYAHLKNRKKERRRFLTELKFHSNENPSKQKIVTRAWKILPAWLNRAAETIRKNKSFYEHFMFLVRHTPLGLSSAGTLP